LIRSGAHLPRFRGFTTTSSRVCARESDALISRSRYVSGGTDNWIKVKNPAAPAVKREAEEDWGRR